ncbi:MAG: hypothetical protein ACRCXT_02265, partial [Paraclostridium sp.]
TTGYCTICGKETKWDEVKCRYDRLCDDKECYNEYIRIFRNNMMNARGVEHMLNDPEHQKKMLSNRRISGEYKFTDGGIRSYCGSYEKKLLEFYDKVLNVHSKDIQTPGPVIEYEFEGKKRSWITDIYYIPFNLVHDVKDGGDNPNKREMDIYRAKQVAKEEAIVSQGVYNYIRLTNNEFKQLIEIFVLLKDQLMDNIDNKIIKINEVNKSNILVPYYQFNSLIGIGYTTSTDMNEFYIIEDGVMVKKNPSEFLTIYEYSLMKSENNNYIDISSITSYDNLYETVTGNKLMDPDQIMIDRSLHRVLDIFTECSINIDITNSSFSNTINEMSMDNIILPLTNRLDIVKRDNINKIYENVDILSSMNGYIAYNMKNKRSSNCYNSIDDIPCDILTVLNKNGVL